VSLNARDEVLSAEYHNIRASQGTKILWLSQLQNANLHYANLENTMLWGANLSEAKNLTQDQINETCIDENTKFPEGLTRPAQGFGVPSKCAFAKPR
jgi:uncharacterized protein YjbI with pentapeptide repeats